MIGARANGVAPFRELNDYNAHGSTLPDGAQPEALSDRAGTDGGCAPFAQPP
jgi:hypothetical protein